MKKIRQKSKFAPVAFGMAMSFALPAVAQDNPLGRILPQGGLQFDLGVGIDSSPEYFGAEDNEIGPKFRFSSSNGPKNGFSVAPSFRFIDERNDDESSELAGLDDIDASLEVGGRLRYSQERYEAFAAVRYGIVGHESFVGEVGGDVILRPTDAITLRAGPRLLWGDEDFSQTYFGITDAESAASGFDAFSADGGLVSGGLKAEAAYQFDENWGIVGTVQYDRLTEDAADSPLTASDDQVTGSIVITRRVTFGF